MKNVSKGSENKKTNMKNKKKNSKSKQGLGLQVSISPVKKLKKKKKSKHKIKRHSLSKKSAKDGSTENKQKCFTRAFHNGDLNIDIDNISSQAPCAYRGSSNESSKKILGNAKNVYTTMEAKSKKVGSPPLLQEFSESITQQIESTPCVTRQHRDIASNIGIAETTEGSFGRQRSKLNEIRSELEAHLDKSTSNVLMAQVAALLSMTPQSPMTHNKKKKKKHHKKSKHESKDGHRKSKKKNRDSHKKKKRKRKANTLSTKKSLKGSEIVKGNNDAPSGNKDILINLQPLPVHGRQSSDKNQQTKNSSAKALTTLAPTVAITTATTTPTERIPKGKIVKASSTQIKQLINSLPTRAAASPRTNIVNKQQGQSTRTHDVAMGTSQQSSVNKPSVLKKELAANIGQQKKRNVSCSFDDESENDITHPNFKKIMKDIDNSTLPDLDSMIVENIEENNNHATNVLGKDVGLEHSKDIEVSNSVAGLVTTVMHLKKNGKTVRQVVENNGNDSHQDNTAGNARIKNVAGALKTADEEKKEREKKHGKLKKKSRKTKSDGKHKKSKHKISKKKKHKKKESKLKKKNTLEGLMDCEVKDSAGNLNDHTEMEEGSIDCFNEIQHMNGKDITIDLNSTQLNSSNKDDECEQMRSMLMMIHDDDDNKSDLSEMLATAEGVSKTKVSTGQSLYESKAEIIIEDINETKTKHARKTPNGTKVILDTRHEGDIAISQPKNSKNFDTKSVEQVSDLKRKHAHKKKKKKSKKSKEKDNTPDARQDQINKSDNDMNIPTEDKDSVCPKEDEHIKGKKHKKKKKKKDKVYKGNIYDPLAYNLEFKFTKALDETLVSEKSKNVHVKNKKNKNKENKLKNMEMHIIETTQVDDSLIETNIEMDRLNHLKEDQKGNSMSLLTAEEIDEELIVKKCKKKKKDKKKHHGEGNLEQLAQLRSMEDGSIEIHQKSKNIPHKRKADDETDVSNTQGIKSKKKKYSGEKIDAINSYQETKIVPDNTTGHGARIIAVSVNNQSPTQQNQCDVINMEDDEEPTKSLVFQQKKKKKSKKNMKDLSEHPAGEEPNIITASNQEKENSLMARRQDYIGDQLITCRDEASAEKSCDMEQDALISKKKKKPKRSIEITHGEEDEMKTGSNNTIEGHLITYREEKVAAESSISKKKKKKYKRSMESSQGQEDEVNTGHSGIVEDNMATLREKEVSAEKSCEIAEDETSISRKKKHKRSIESSQGQEDEVNTGYSEIVEADKSCEIADEETSISREKKHKQSIEMGPGGDNEVKTGSHNDAEEQLVTFGGEEVSEDKGSEVAEEETSISRKKKKKKHKRSIEMSPGGENEVKTGSHNDAEEHLVTFGGEEVSEDKGSEVAEEETIIARKRKKKKHKRSIEMSPVGEDDGKTGSHNNAEHLVTFGKEEVVEDKGGEIAEEENSLSKKKEKKHKQSMESSQGQKDEVNTGHSEIKDNLATLREKEVSADKSCELAEEETSISRKKKKKKHKRSIEMGPGGENEVKTGSHNDAEEHLVTFGGEEVSEDKGSKVAEEETIIARKRKKKKHKRSIEMGPVGEDDGKTGSHNYAEHLVTFGIEEVLEDKGGEIAEEENSISRKKKKKKHKQFMESSQGQEDELNTGHSEIVEDNLATFREKEVSADKSCEIAEEETSISRKKKKKKHKRSIEMSPGGENEVKTGSHNDAEEHLVTFGGEEVSEDKGSEVAEEETIIARKRKKKKHKRSIEMSPVGEDDGKTESHNNAEHLVTFGREEVVEDKGGEIAEEENSLSKKKKPKRSIENNQPQEAEILENAEKHLSTFELQVVSADTSCEIVQPNNSLSTNKNVSKKKEKEHKISFDENEPCREMNEETALEEDQTNNKKRKVSGMEPVMDKGTSSSEPGSGVEKEVVVHNNCNKEQEELQKAASDNVETHKEKHKDNRKELIESEHEIKDDKKENIITSKDNMDKILCENTEEMFEDDISISSDNKLVIDETVSSGSNDVAPEGDSTNTGVKSEHHDSDETCIDGESSNQVEPSNAPTRSDDTEVWADSVRDERTQDDGCVIMELQNTSHAAPKFLTDDNHEGFLQDWKFTSRGFPKNAKAWRNLTAPMPQSWKYEGDMNDEESLQDTMIKSFYTYYWKCNPDLLNKKHKKSIDTSCMDDTTRCVIKTEIEDSDSSENNDIYLPAEVHEVISF